MDGPDFEWMDEKGKSPATNGSEAFAIGTTLNQNSESMISLLARVPKAPHNP